MKPWEVEPREAVDGPMVAKARRGGHARRPTEMRAQRVLMERVAPPWLGRWPVSSGPSECRARAHRLAASASAHCWPRCVGGDGGGGSDDESDGGGASGSRGKSRLRGYGRGDFGVCGLRVLCHCCCDGGGTMSATRPRWPSDHRHRRACGEVYCAPAGWSGVCGCRPPRSMDDGGCASGVFYLRLPLRRYRCSVVSRGGAAPREGGVRWHRMRPLQGLRECGGCWC